MINLSEYRRVLREALGEICSRSGPFGEHGELMRVAATVYWKKFIEPVVNYFWSIEVGSDAKQALLIGVVAGAAVVGGLIMFPGEPFDYGSNEFLKDGPKKIKNEADRAALGEDEGKGPSTKPSESSSRKKKQKKKKAGDNEAANSEARVASSGAGSGETTGTALADRPTKPEPAAGQPDPFSDPKLKDDARRAAKFFGLSQAQLNKAVEDAKYEFETGVPPPSKEGMSAMDVAHLFNHLIIFGLFCAMIWAINKDYGGAATKFLITHFPREASALKIPYPTK